MQIRCSQAVQRIIDSPRAKLMLAARGKVSLAAGEPDFATPAPIVEAAVEALRRTADVFGIL